MSNKYDKKSPTIIKFSEIGAKFMQLNMVAHDYAHDFNPGESIGKERLKKSFDHVINIIKYVNDPINAQMGGHTATHNPIKKAHREQNIFGKKQYTLKFIKSQNDKKRKTNKFNVILTKPASPIISNSFSKKINMLVDLTKPRFILYFYNKALEDSIYVFVFELLGFINYSTHSVKSNSYLRYIKEGFKFYNENPNNKENLSKYINPTIYKHMHSLFSNYFDIIYRENRHACYLNILKDNILIQKLKIGFILLSTMSEYMLKKIDIPALIGYIDGIHVQLFSYLYYSEINISRSKMLIGLSSTTSSNSISYSDRMSGGNAMFAKNKQSTFEDCMVAENKINELKQYVKQNIYTDETSVYNNSIDYLTHEMKKLFDLTEKEEKNIKKLCFMVKPESRNSEQKLDYVVDSIFSYISTIYSANCGELIRLKKEQDERIARETRKEQDALESELKREFSTRMTKVGWNIVGLVAKMMLIRNGICTDSGDFTPSYENMLKTEEDSIDKQMLIVEVDILKHIGFPRSNKTMSDLDDIIKEETIYILKNHPQLIKSRSSFDPLIKLANSGEKILINNAVSLFENKISDLKIKSFCPLSSVLDGMANCSPSTIVNEPQTFESGITHFTIVGDDESLPYFDGMMEFVNKEKANISIQINNSGFESMIYQDNDISIKEQTILQAAAVFKTQAEYIIRCLSSMHETIISDSAIKDSLIWDLFLNWTGPNNEKYYFTNNLIKIGNRKSLGDVFQEINGVCKNGAYIKSSYKSGKLVYPHFSRNIDAPRIVLSHDRPSGVRIAFILTRALGDSINPNSAGGYSGVQGGEDAILLSRVPIT